MSATVFAMQPVGVQSAASTPSRSATRAWSAARVGSPSRTSSPTSAPAIASRMAGEGRVTVSERRSIRPAHRGSFTTDTKKSSIWRMTSMKRSKSTGLATYAFA